MSLQKGPLRGLTLEKIGGQIYCSAMIPTWTPYTSSVWCLFLRRAHSEAWPWRRLVVRSTVVLWYLPGLHIHLLFDVSWEGPTQRPDLGEDWWSDLLQCYDTYLNSIYIFCLMSLQKGPLRGLSLEKIGGQIYCSAMIPTWTPYTSSTTYLDSIYIFRMVSLEKGPLRGLTLEKFYCGSQIFCSAMIPTWTPYTSSGLTLMSWEGPTQRPDLQRRRLVVRSTVVLWYLPGLHIHLQIGVSWEGSTQRPDLGEDW